MNYFKECYGNKIYESDFQTMGTSDLLEKSRADRKQSQNESASTSDKIELANAAESILRAMNNISHLNDSSQGYHEDTTTAVSANNDAQVIASATEHTDNTNTLSNNIDTLNGEKEMRKQDTNNEFNDVINNIYHKSKKSFNIIRNIEENYAIDPSYEYNGSQLKYIATVKKYLNQYNYNEFCEFINDFSHKYVITARDMLLFQILYFTDSPQYYLPLLEEDVFQGQTLYGVAPFTSFENFRKELRENRSRK